MMASRVNKDSKHILKDILPNTKGAEIGVWAGNTSMQFLRLCISELHMIDPWSVEPYKKSKEYKNYDEYLEKYSKILDIEKQDVDFQEYYDAIYSEVYAKCGMDSRVTINRMTSDEWFATKPEKLDWIYVDGDHSYEGCLRDLENSLKVVKPGGIIMGDDYYWKHARYGKEGVTNAVDRFCKRYMLFKEPRGETQFILRV